MKVGRDACNADTNLNFARAPATSPSALVPFLPNIGIG